LSFLKDVWLNYRTKTDRDLKDFEAICFHLPYTKMAKKAILSLTENAAEEDAERLMSHYQNSIAYNKQVGNVYTGSLYLSMLSLIEQSEELAEGSRIGLFSYGSGAVGEFFSGVIQPGYKAYLNKEAHETLLSSRRELSLDEYEELLEKSLPKDGTDIETNSERMAEGRAYLAAIQDNIRKYKVK
ncbi:MAG: hydroxymethylglutaryl-CoA synthase, partial [Alkalibacterium sp.]